MKYFILLKIILFLSIAEIIISCKLKLKKIYRISKEATHLMVNLFLKSLSGVLRMTEPFELLLLPKYPR
jgi:hypothetical protein